MQALKHIGKVRKTGTKVVVVFRQVPNEPYNALVLGVNSLSDMYHNSLMQLLENEQGQQASNFGEAMATRFFPDGRQMLQAMHLDGRLQKFPTADIDMTPTSSNSISLEKLNELIAEQKGITVEQMAGLESEEPVKEPASETPTAKKDPMSPLSDSDLARQYRSQADALFKEAQRLRKQADDL
ncbi:hypothetical protein EBU71_06110, partial [bacterium]|nr:hypothetical protein [Candidatus Elulimicrobium humile]